MMTREIKIIKFSDGENTIGLSVDNKTYHSISNLQDPNSNESKSLQQTLSLPSDTLNLHLINIKGIYENEAQTVQAFLRVILNNIKSGVIKNNINNLIIDKADANTVPYLLDDLLEYLKNSLTKLKNCHIHLEQITIGNSSKSAARKLLESLKALRETTQGNISYWNFALRSELMLHENFGEKAVKDNSILPNLYLRPEREKRQAPPIR